VDWNLFFDGGPTSAQRAYRLDGSLVPPLRLLPLPAIAFDGPTTLATRNLLRGQQIGLPATRR
jgi:hypothetical protein